MLHFQNKSTAGSYADGIVIKGCAFLSQGIPFSCILKMLLDYIYIYVIIFHSQTVTLQTLFKKLVSFFLPY